MLRLIKPCGNVYITRFAFFRVHVFFQNVFCSHTAKWCNKL